MKPIIGTETRWVSPGFRRGQPYDFAGENRVRHLPVVHDGKAVGIVSRNDFPGLSPADSSHAGSNRT